MRMIQTGLVLVILLSFYFLVAKDFIDFNDSYKDVNAYEAYNLMKIYPNLKIIDVSGMYSMGHIPGSINLFIGDGSLDEALAELSKNDRYLIYYHTDTTSKEAAEKFLEAGFKKIYRLDGNFSSWVEAGFETASL
ncbi:MAG: rhodanese-like domain-containing protein [Candidatus Cloacimonetes bacterium]|nr:rhodanese-like domain-containing protein [Candidatus Cloacimonadota bacterium]MCF7869122.1 rhodanese-like domain-containing protein [Candidatus Cloacimonadota bacterium]MCF7884542.1 rhodanese-like domain-containing protein [Candidatus Cloacimonadota bacterium]